MEVYNIVLEIQDADPVVLKRSQEALELFARDLDSFTFPAEINESRVALATQQAVPSTNIQSFLLYCFQNVEIVHSKAVANFLWEPAEENVPSSPSPTAIDFILQPLENRQIYIPQNQQFFIDVRLEKGETLVWRYHVGCGQEIDFFAICCHALFRNVKQHPNHNLDTQNSIDKDNDAPDVEPSSPKSYDVKLSESLDEFIKIGQHRSVDNSQKERPSSFPNVSIVTATYATLALGSWRYIPFMRSTASSQTKLPTPQTGCYQAQTKGGLCRLLWDNTVCSISGKHLEYCVQKVSEETMQAALKAADDSSVFLSIPRSKSYIALLSCSSPTNVTVAVDGPYSTDFFEGVEPSSSLASRYLEDMSPGDHLRFVTEERSFRENILEDTDVVLPTTSNSTVISTHTNSNSWPGSYLINSLYSVPVASGALVSLGVTQGVAGLGVIGGLVKSIVTPFAATKQIPKEIIPDTTLDMNGNKHLSQPQRCLVTPTERLSWMTSLLTPYVRAAWSIKSDSVGNEKGQSTENFKFSKAPSGMIQDLLTLAKKVDELEDEVNIKTAERDQLRAQLEIFRQYNETEMEDLIKKQVIFENEYLDLRENNRQSASENQSKDEEIQTLRLRLERAESLLEKSYKESGVWNAARDAVEERLSKLSSDHEVTRFALMKLEDEKRSWIKSRLQWDEERRELCQRVAELEKEKEDMDIQESPPSTLNIAILRERDELAQTVADYIRRLDELQSEALLYRAQRRIDEREIKMLRRESEEKIMIAKSEVLECRMIVQGLREKLAKVKGEKKVLIAELRALREMGLYQGPLTRDGHEFGGETGPRQSGDNTPPKHTAPSAIENMVEEDGGMEHEKLQYQVILLELEERKRVIQSMLKADPDSRSLQQLSLQLETQAQSILQRVQTFNGSNSSSIIRSEAPLPSHEEWLQSSFQDWNSV